MSSDSVAASEESSLPLCLVRSAGAGLTLRAAPSSSFDTGAVLLSELPLALLHPFDDALSSHAALQAAARALAWRDDATVLYRGAQLFYLLYLSVHDASAEVKSKSERVAARILAQWDPSAESSLGDDSSERSRMEGMRRDFAAALESGAGVAALCILFTMVAKQALFDLGIAKVNITPSTLPQLLHSLSFSLSLTPASSSLRSLPLTLLRLSFIFNANNMDLVWTPPSSRADAPQSGDSVKGIYDSLSRLNHSCASSCVHYLEHEARYHDQSDPQRRAQLEKQVRTLTPQKLEGMRQAMARGEGGGGAAGESPLFLRSLRALMPIAGGSELTISYLSPHLLAQSTHRRRALLRQHWSFLCRCARCLDWDRARVLVCPQCKVGSLWLRPSGDDVAEGENAPSSSTAYATSCGCVLLASQITSQLQRESTLEKTFDGFRASLASSTQPLALVRAYRLAFAEQALEVLHPRWHQLRYELDAVWSDLCALIGPGFRVAHWNATARMMRYLEHALRRGGEGGSQSDDARPPQDDEEEADRAQVLADQDLSQCMRVDPSAADYTSPAARVRDLYACADLRDSYAMFADLSWQLASAQTASSAELRQSLQTQSLYFLACARLVGRLLQSGASAQHALAEPMASLEQAWQQRVKAAETNGVNVRAILGADPELQLLTSQLETAKI